MRRFIIGPPYPTGREFGDGPASVISPARRMMPAQTSRPRPSGLTCTCLPRQSTLAPTAASESPRITEAVAPRASRTQVGHRQRATRRRKPHEQTDRPGAPHGRRDRQDTPLPRLRQARHSQPCSTRRRTRQPGDKRRSATLTHEALNAQRAVPLNRTERRQAAQRERAITGDMRPGPDDGRTTLGTRRPRSRERGF
jgi:hypothetical protein